MVNRIQPAHKPNELKCDMFYSHQFGRHYGPLSPAKWMFHDDLVDRLLTNTESMIAPVTVHLVSTLRCNHCCYFCTYGGSVGNGTEFRQGVAVADRSRLRILKRDMDFDLMKTTLEQLAEVGSKGIIFTGGGEPTLYPYLADAMEYCRNLGLDFAMNTNGRHLSDEFVARLMSLNPTYVRVSLNSGSPQMQRLITGVDDFERVVANIEKLLRYKSKYRSSTDVSIGYVVNTVNLFDIMGIVRTARRIEERLARDGISDHVFSIQFRPVGNYEGSKKYSLRRIEEITDYLTKGYGIERAQEFSRFMFERENCSADVLDQALRILDGEATEYCSKHNLRVSLVYPRQKFLDLPRLGRKPYDSCSVLPLFLFVWPDGAIYSCVEWAGTPGFEIGSLAEKSLRELLFKGARNAKIEEINRVSVPKRCPTVCAHHEMNLGLEEFRSCRARFGAEKLRKVVEEAKRSGENPRHRNFL